MADEKHKGTRTKDISGVSALAAVFIDHHGKEAKIPEEEVKRWMLMSDLQIKQKGFNKQRFMDKMIAGYLMDHETTRKYIVIEGLDLFQQMKEIMQEVHRRVVDDERTLCEEELGMLTGMAKVSESFTNMMESIIKISGGGKAVGKAVAADAPANEQPNFYKQEKQEIHLHVNGDKPTEKVINIPPQENRGP